MLRHLAAAINSIISPPLQWLNIPIIHQVYADATCTQPRDVTHCFILVTRKIRRKKRVDITLLRGVEPGLPWWEFDVTTTILPIFVVFQILQLI